MKKAPPTWRELLERLHAARRLLETVYALSHGERLPADMLEAIDTLERSARRRLCRPEIAAYADDVEAFARHVLGELLTARTRRLQ